MKTAWLFLRWVFSNSGAIQGSRGSTNIDPKTSLIYMAGNHPLEMKKCHYCKIIYWAFTKGNKYCGQFACFKRMHEV